MKYETFEKLITELQNISGRLSKLYDLGVDLINFDEPNQRVITILMEELFGKEGMGWIDWFVYERISHNGEILGAWDKDKNPICYDIKSLWEEVKNDLQNYKYVFSKYRRT